MTLARAPRIGRPTSLPVSFFSIVLGLAGLGNTWRVAHRVWGLPASVGEAICAVSAVVWAVLLLCYIVKWLLTPAYAAAELDHPVDSSFVGLAGVATMLIANAALPYSRPVALVLYGGGAVFTLGYAFWQTGAAWKGDRDHASTTGALYLPTVAGSFVTGTVAAALGFADWGQFAFGAGVFSWLSIESVLLHRLLTVSGLPLAQRPSLGIQFAPAAVAGVTYMSITSGPPDLFVRALVGYAVLQACILLRLLPWILQQRFTPSYWAFTFGAASLATTLLDMVERGASGATAVIAPYVFVGANVVIGLISAVTIRGWLAKMWPRMQRDTHSSGAHSKR